MGATPWERAILCLSADDRCFRRREEIKRRPANAVGSAPVSGAIDGWIGSWA
jgi:hypothetical protein